MTAWRSHRSAACAPAASSTAARRAADRELLETQLPPPRLAWRTNELCSGEHRRALAETLVDVVRSSESRFLPGASPLNRGAVRDGTDLLLRIASILADRTRRVSPRGVLLVERLLTDGGGPLYSRDVEDRLRHDLDEAYITLEAVR